MTPIKTAIIGVGHMGAAHAACLAAGEAGALALTALCDTDPRRLDFCAQRFPGAARYASWQAMLAAEALEAVIVATPHPAHGEIACACLEAGLHVLVEKPADIALSRVRRMSAAARRSGRRYALMFNQRTDPLFRRCRELMQAGALGELKRVTWVVTNWYRTQAYYDSGTWRATWAGEGGGVLLNQAPHNLDLWQWLCGMPVAVTAWCPTKYHRIEVEDEAVLRVRYANGATGVFITSTGEYPGENRLEIAGTLGRVVLEGGQMRLWQLEQPEDAVRFQDPASFARIPLRYDTWTPGERGAAHPGVLRNFAEAIRTGAPLIAPGEEGEREIELSNAAYLSQWTGNREVPLPLDTAAFDRELAQRVAASAYDPRKRSHAPQGDGSYSERWQVRW